MKYGKPNGPAYCRYARTRPVLNSAFASEFGIQADMGIKPQPGIKIEEGRNVKLRLILDNRRIRMTCHAQIDWVEVDEETGEYRVFFSQLSLSDDEYKVLLENLSEEPRTELTFGRSIRHAEEAALPLTKGLDDKEILRDKALTLPVRLIEEIDARRGATPFSEFVVAVLEQSFIRD
ncbi:MAG: hypothetical protein GY906_25435 [bacterium]|nr:hypothetical protein [bacterium]